MQDCSWMQASSFQKKAVVKVLLKTCLFICQTVSGGHFLQVLLSSAAVSPKSLLIKQSLRKVSIQGLNNRWASASGMVKRALPWASLLSLPILLFCKWKISLEVQHTKKRKGFAAARQFWFCAKELLFHFQRPISPVLWWFFFSFSREAVWFGHQSTGCWGSPKPRPLRWGNYRSL